MSWKQAWKEDRTPWDQGASSPVVHDLVKANALPHGRGLVPGAGSGYDVLALASNERRMIGLDLSELAVQRFERLREEAAVDREHAQMHAADFFNFEAPPFNFIWDYTFLCAIEPEQRQAWGERVRTLLKPDGQLFVLVFPTTPIHDDPNRPPYVLSVELVSNILGPDFRLELCEPVQNSRGNRRGREVLARWSAPSST